MLYSKNGSIPKPEMSGDKEGWIEVEALPEVPEGKELVWWFPPGWVVRDPKPADTETTRWKWNQSTEQWIEYPKPEVVQNTVITSEPVETNMASAQPTTEV